MKCLLTPFFLLASLQQQLPAAEPFVHPGIAHNQRSIDFIKGKLKAGQEPWTKLWKSCHAHKSAALDWKPQPRAKVERGVRNKPDIGGTEFLRDGDAAYTHALHWALTGEKAHARKSAEIILAWSHTLETVENHDAKLLVGMGGHKYCNAVELLKHSGDGWEGWTGKDQAAFESMLRKVWYPVIKDFYPSANGNWDAAMLQTMIAMGVVLDDRAIFDRATNYYLKGKGNGAVRNYFFPSGQCQESGRDQGHTQMGLEFLANTCETAWNQQLDLYGAYDKRLLKGFEYTAKYNLGHDVPYAPYKSFEGRYHYKSISDKGRGQLRAMFEKVYNHYHHRKGLTPNYTKMALDKTRPEEDGRGTLPWGSLMYTRQPSPSAGR
ncbi:MAG: alginate lyase family protein [Akkermansiaceae bacterium]|nr:alginate lyase family protein [Akkermansiaceae bacterium]